jgi:hypothetical protein
MAEYDCTTQGAISLAAFTKLMRPTLRATRRLDMRELLVSPASTSSTTAAAAATAAAATADLSNSRGNSSAHSSGTSKALPTAATAAASGSSMLSSRGSFRGGSSAVYSTGGGSSGSQRVRRLSYRGVPIGVSNSGSASGTLEELNGSGHSRRRLSGTAVSNPSVSFASIRLSAMSGNLARLAAEVRHAYYCVHSLHVLHDALREQQAVLFDSVTCSTTAFTSITTCC